VPGRFATSVETRFQFVMYLFGIGRNWGQPANLDFSESYCATGTTRSGLFIRQEIKIDLGVSCIADRQLRTRYPPIMNLNDLQRPVHNN
jgi:hypothetical protein